MDKVKALVVYYSRSGNTEKAAKYLAQKLAADLEKIEDNQNRSGILGYLKSGKQSMMREDVEIIKPQFDASQYDIVLVGTPVWSMTCCAPVKAYLKKYGGKITQAAYFCAMGGLGDKGVYKAMEEACGCAPVACLALTEADMSEDYEAKADIFLSEVKNAVG